uniref:Uncharacterized protein n=1 Tax=Rhizophora mucronata TaxID=61149 RepID=A0A2P2QI60_RHIMU
MQGMHYFKLNETHGFWSVLFVPLIT